MIALRNFAMKKAKMDGRTFKNMDEQCEPVSNKRRDNEVLQKLRQEYCEECKSIKEEIKRKAPIQTLCCVRIFVYFFCKEIHKFYIVNQ